jgi:hypothetical protein
MARLAFVTAAALEAFGLTGPTAIQIRQMQLVGKLRNGARGTSQVCAQPERQPQQPSWRISEPNPAQALAHHDANLAHQWVSSKE